MPCSLSALSSKPPNKAETKTETEIRVCGHLCSAARACAPGLSHVWEHTSALQLGEDVCVNVQAYIRACRVGMWFAQGDGKLGERTHLSHFWRLSFKSWGICTLTSLSLISSTQPSVLYIPLRKTHLLTFTPWWIWEIFIPERFTPWFMLILCFTFSQRSTKFCLSFHPLRFHTNHEKPDSIVQEIRELTPRMFCPMQFPVW